MNRENVQSLPAGIYRIFWKEGGSSIAAVGVTAAGGRWIAPLNWVAPSEDQNVWKKVESVTRLRND